MLTVVLATHNGAQTLPKTLESMQKLKVPDGGWKLIIVDNVSNDSTAEILKKFSDSLPMVILYQVKRGKNASLNMAIPHFEGELVIFTDDDVILMPEWLLAFEELARKHTAYSIFGGRVAPEWPSDPPACIIDSIPLSPAFAVHPKDLCDGPANHKGNIWVWGANMAVRHQIFRFGYRFNESIGPTIGNYPMGSETEFTRRLHKDGFKCWFANDIIVKHQIRNYQLTPKWLFVRAIRHGKGKCAADVKIEKSEGHFIFGIPRWRIGQFLKDLLFFPFELMITLITKDCADFLRLIWRIGFNSAILRNEIKLKWKI